MADTLTITDNRTGKQFEIPITNGTIRALDLRQIKVSPDEFGLMTYDPAFQNTASCKSRITFIDGDKGILRYRGYPIEQLAEKSTFLETSYLLLNGELPTTSQLDTWSEDSSSSSPSSSASSSSSVLSASAASSARATATESAIKESASGRSYWKKLRPME